MCSGPATGWAAGDPRVTAGAPAGRRLPHALVMMLLIITAAVALTWIVPSGRYDRTPAGLVVPGTYHAVPKDYRAGLLHPAGPATDHASPASPLAIVTSIPAGMVGAASLVFMIMFIGGMFGVLQETGALEAGIEGLLGLTRGNVLVLVPLLMLVIAAGSTFLGLISEYLVLIPIVVLLAERLGLDNLFATAVVTVAAKIGYMTSVTNPLALAVAQPMVGVPVFSGAGFRLATFVLYLALGTWWVLRYVRRRGPGRPAEAPAAPRLSLRHGAILVLLLAAIGLMVYGAQSLAWGNAELSAMYVFLALAIAVLGGLDSASAAHGFLQGMRAMVLAGLLVGLAKSVEIVLHDGQVLDSIIAFLSRAAEGRPRVLAAQAMLGIEMVIDVFIPSTSGKAAVTMPILGPIGQLAGVSGQVIVQAFIFGNGLTNAVTPTSGMLLAYLAAGKVGYGEWIRFVLPLILLLTVLSLAGIAVAVVIGL
jgi:uncharacterized ion transporter superfamily protein YfcC